MCLKFVNTSADGMHIILSSDMQTTLAFKLESACVLICFLLALFLPSNFMISLLFALNVLIIIGPFPPNKLKKVKKSIYWPLSYQFFARIRWHSF